MEWWQIHAIRGYVPFSFNHLSMCCLMPTFTGWMLSNSVPIRYTGHPWSVWTGSDLDYSYPSYSFTVVDYCLTPQYPFPCAIQDLLVVGESCVVLLYVKLKTSLDIFLIRPPEGAVHCLIRPEHIVTAGDSASCGLSLALFQVRCDSCLPVPAGHVLILLYPFISQHPPKYQHYMSSVFDLPLMFDSMPTIRTWHQ